ncbi:IS66 family insertion sequence element accessory protein TnpB [Tahibacter amnicola]|uniref:IS66 family insertion sequence element accessory protein TnpB n=1 Tax=Tahibacter amnicola TaxID=2976241 RepID=A0ABY6BFJ9_9GAMM|nr:IS66 family insertion sequence element accessory protein TnpB [Tahibacter amnicola]UXI68544.1 IS66 family insertion sequence element accessory protein TnpB [Tahibacter amnicola]
MLSPTAWWIAIEPVDLRCGMDRLLATIAIQFGHDGAAGGAYVFRNRSGTRIKVVCADGSGVWMCVRRLREGRFVWPRSSDRVCEIDAQSFAWLCTGVDWHRLCARPLVGALV